MSVFVEVQVERIQQYLARWDQLAGRRGASAVVSSATSPLPDTVKEWTRGVGQLCDDAPDVDGKFTVRIDGDGDHRRVAEVAEQLLVRVAEELPAAELVARWTRADTYLDAQAFLITAPRAPDAVTGPADGGSFGELRGVPVLRDFPLARPCDLCGVSPSTTRFNLHGERRTCWDCRRRSPTEQRRGRPERHLLDAERFDGLTSPADFECLAGIGEDGGNHLATVYIDGNRIGWFFSQLADESSEVKRAVSRGMADATVHALCEATAAVHDEVGGDVLPLAAHVVGGDDVLVSMPAARGWRFTRTYLASFEAHTRDLVAKHVGGLSVAPTASAGMLVTHFKHPFAACVTAADALLEDAKSRPAHGTEGATGDGAGPSTVAWGDLTSDGAVPVPRRRPWTLQQLQDHAPRFEEVRGWSPSARRTVTDLLARGNHVARAGLDTVAKRRGDELVGLSPLLKQDADLSTLAEVIDIVRWWS